MKKTLLLFFIILFFSLISFFAGYFFYEKLNSSSKNNPDLLTNENNNSINSIKQETSTPVISISPSPTKFIKNYSEINLYKDPNGKFQFYYPKDFQITKQDFGDSVRYILNHHITWYIGKFSIEDCQGDCPIIEKKEVKNINNLTALKFKGLVGTVGGNIPQKFIAYEIKNPKKPEYFVIYFWELEQDISYKEAITNYPLNRQLKEITPQQEEILDKIISTFQFLDY